MKSKLLALALLAGSSLFAAPAIGVGIELGAPPPPHVRVVRPPVPGPNYAWVDGFYEPAGGQYRWREGYWASRPYARAVWVAPRYRGHRYYPGYWRR
jgi:ABC-type nitrate/sulfonate/bicarbonate transport system substrate-binding protein